MRSSKELWFDLYVEFENEHGREPTWQEMQSAQSDHYADLGDYYKDMEKDRMMREGR